MIQSVPSLMRGLPLSLRIFKDCCHCFKKKERTAPFLSAESKLFVILEELVLVTVHWLMTWKKLLPFFIEIK